MGQAEEIAEVILVFSSNTMILNAEDLLESKDLPFVLVPVPKEVNPNCGLAISFEEKDAAAIMGALEAAGLMPAAGYMRLGGRFSAWPVPGQGLGPGQGQSQGRSQGLSQGQVKGQS